MYWRRSHFFWWSIVCEDFITTKESDNHYEYHIDLQDESEIFGIFSKFIGIYDDYSHKSEYDEQQKAVDSKKYEIHYQKDKK